MLQRRLFARIQLLSTSIISKHQKNVKNHVDEKYKYTFEQTIQIGGSAAIKFQKPNDGVI
ncbi:hypothetical protein KM620_gp106 [Hyposidra talaca nucleopolyhedrovirus]|uniref:Uncharacterized protein n=1 Tax=Hyposidra talaca nucleopolyhedrovirus TaxID=1070315 RepID=A0A2Z4HI58_9ABAC|nr:hypothetical protein KM620_gp106 [Hyposidra talaca nucleopolyhedrovirus]AWW14466.1 hypothetical protein HytaNPV_gp106 [Hyposidra talaca nucleopolyhedrovirus]